MSLILSLVQWHEPVIAKTGFSVRLVEPNIFIEGEYDY